MVLQPTRKRGPEGLARAHGRLGQLHATINKSPEWLAHLCKAWHFLLGTLLRKKDLKTPDCDNIKPSSPRLPNLHILRKPYIYGVSLAVVLVLQ